MSNIEKLKKKFYSIPTRNDISMDEIRKLSKYYGCLERTGGNHQSTIINPKTGRIVPLPQHGKVIKREYVRQLQELFGDEGSQEK